MNISKLIAIVSLNVVGSLVTGYGFSGGTLPVTAATITTPIEVTSAGHGIPAGRTLHAVLAGAQGMTEANGLWIFTVVDANTLSLSTLDPQGNVVQSVGVHAYTGGGTITYAFPPADGRILLGKRNVKMQSGVVSPRIVFVPTNGKAWGFESYGAFPDLATVPTPGQRGQRGRAEQQAMTTQPQVATEFPTFEVYITACAAPNALGLGGAPTVTNPIPDPDGLDFDAVQALSNVLVSTLFDMFGGRWRVLHESWPSQGESKSEWAQRGQQQRLIVELQTPITKIALGYVPIGTVIEETVTPVGGGSGDSTIITVS